MTRALPAVGTDLAKTFARIRRQPQLPKGHTSILSPTFRYVPAASTDLAQTFARIRSQRLAQLGAGASAPVWKPKAAG